MRLIVFGLRTVDHLDTKERFYRQIEVGTLDATPRLSEAALRLISGRFALGVLSSHSLPRIKAVLQHLGWTRYFPLEYAISSEGLDRKEPANWKVWREQYRRRGLELTAVVDAGLALLQNLAAAPAFASIRKYHLTPQATSEVSGIIPITSLDQMAEYGEFGS